jgi:hypothetical protein
MGFERTIPVFQWAKTVHALDRAAIVIGGDSDQDEEEKLLVIPAKGGGIKQKELLPSERASFNNPKINVVSNIKMYAATSKEPG